MKKIPTSEPPQAPSRSAPAVAGKWTDESLPMRLRKQLMRAELEEVQRQKAERTTAGRSTEGPSRT